MSRFMVLVTVALLMLAAFVVTVTPASALIVASPRGGTGPGGVPVEPTSARETLAGGFEWRAGGRGVLAQLTGSISHQEQ
jgi:hypothetical protein